MVPIVVKMYCSIFDVYLNVSKRVSIWLNYFFIINDITCVCVREKKTLNELEETKIILALSTHPTQFEFVITDCPTGYYWQTIFL